MPLAYYNACQNDKTYYLMNNDRNEEIISILSFLFYAISIVKEE